MFVDFRGKIFISNVWRSCSKIWIFWISIFLGSFSRGSYCLWKTIKTVC